MGGGLDDHLLEEDLRESGGSCVIEGTLIQTIRGSIPVEWIEIGDLVYSYDFEKSDFGFFKVLGLNVPVEKKVWSTVTTELGYKLNCTFDHPIFSDSIESGELPVKDADIGSPVYVFEDGNLIKDSIASIEVKKSKVTVYNFEVDCVHTYISDNVLSHNASAKGGGSSFSASGAAAGGPSGASYGMSGGSSGASADLAGVVFMGDLDLTPAEVIGPASHAFGMGGGVVYIEDPGDASSVEYEGGGSSPDPVEAIITDYDPRLTFDPKYLTHYNQTPVVTNVEVILVGEEIAESKNHQITIECTAYIDEPRCFGFGISHIAAQLTIGGSASPISYFKSTKASAASAIMSISSPTPGPKKPTYMEMPETDTAVHVVGQDYWSTVNFPDYGSYVSHTDYPPDEAYPTAEWTEADHGSSEYSYSTFNFSRFTTREGMGASYLAFRNIDPALVNELSSPITNWSAITEGTITSQFNDSVWMNFSEDTLASIDGWSAQNKQSQSLLYEYQRVMSEFDAGSVPVTIKRSARQRFTPVKFYFSAMINEQQLYDITHEQDIRLKMHMISKGESKDYATDDYMLTSCNTSLQVNIWKAVKEWKAGKFFPAEISVSGASQFSNSDIINVINPNSFFTTYVLQESYYNSELSKFENKIHGGILDPYAEVDITSTNSYNPGDLRFYRVTSSTTLHEQIKKVNVAGFSELISVPEYFSSIIINIDEAGNAVINNIPENCLYIEWYAYRKGCLTPASPLFPEGAAEYQGVIEGNPELLEGEPPSAFVTSGGTAKKWEGSLMEAEQDGSCYLIQMIFKDLMGSVLGWYDATFESKLNLPDLGVETIAFTVQEESRSEEFVTFKIYESKSGNLSTEAIDTIMDSSALSDWQSEVDEIKTQTGTVTQYKVVKIDPGTGSRTTMPDTYFAGSTVTCELNMATGEKTLFEFNLMYASLAESSNNTAIETEAGTGTAATADYRAGVRYQYSYLAQEVNWPLLNSDHASPGQTFGLNDYFARLISTKKVTKTVTHTPYIVEPFISSISAVRSEIGRCNIVTVLVGGTQEMVNHYVLYAQYGKVKTPIQILLPDDDEEIVFVDTQNFDFYGTVVYSVKIISANMGVITDITWPSASVTRNNSISLISPVDGQWGDKSILIDGESAG